MVLLSSEMIKNGFLQQNSHDEVDMYCVPEKQVTILGLILRFHRRALALLAAGVPLVRVVGLPVRMSLVRLKSTVPNEELGRLKEISQELDKELDRLERDSRNPGGLL